MYKCNFCGFETDNPKVYANHIRWKHTKYSEEEKQKYREATLGALERGRIKKWGTTEVREVTLKCAQCGKPFRSFRKFKNNETNPEKGKLTGAGGSKICCSKRCAAQYSGSFRGEWSEEARRKCSEENKKRWLNEIYPRKQLSRKFYSSKREREIRDYFIKNYPDDKWTFGKIANFRGEPVNPDLWSRKLKIIFEYDGIWHFKDIFREGDAAEKQRKDRLTEAFCKENDYRIIRIDEAKKLSIKEVEELIYSKSDKIIKIGDRY